MKIRVLIQLFFIFYSLNIYGQKIIHRSQAYSLGNDTIIKFALPAVKGNIQWQISLGDMDWVDIPGKIIDTLIVKPNIEASYRAKIVNGTCSSIFSDSITVMFESPQIQSTTLFQVSVNSAVLGGVLLADGGSPETERGVCVGINQLPTVNNLKFKMGSGEGDFKNTVGGLSPNTNYYARAYALNSKDTVYSNQIQFKTQQTFVINNSVATNSSYVINTPVGANLSIPANTLETGGTVTVAITGQEPQSLPNKDVSIVGNAISLSVPGSSLNGALKLSFPKPVISYPMENYSLFVFDGKSYHPVRYSLSNDSVIVNIDKLNWANDTTKGAKIVSELVCVGLVALQTPPSRMMGLKEITLSGNKLLYGEPYANANSKVILFIHGWIGDPGTWDEFIKYIIEENVFPGYKLWTFGYNSSWGIDQSGQNLYDELAKYTKGAKLNIVAHSMGGLVSRSMLELSGGTRFADKLIALGSPHLGSSLAALQDVIGALLLLDMSVVGSFGYEIVSQGFNDLQQNSGFLKRLNSTGNPPINYYLIPAKNNPSNWPISAEKILEGDDDGIVTVKSATSVPDSKISPVYYVDKSIAHLHMTDNQPIIDQTIAYLKENINLEPPVVEIPGTFSVGTPKCAGSDDGEISFDFAVYGEEITEIKAIVSGNTYNGAVSLSYNLGTDEGMRSTTLQNLSAGVYKIEIQAKNSNGQIGKSDESIIEIYQPEPLSFNLEMSAGSVTVLVMGGTRPYLYGVDMHLNGSSWSSTNTLVVSKGQHKLYVKDANGCTATYDFYMEL